MENDLSTNIVDRIDEKKKRLDNYKPLPPELVTNLEEYCAVDYTYHSNALEGNTLSLSETAIVAEKGITIGGKTIREHLEVINHIEAIDYIKVLARTSRDHISMDDILAIHTMVLQKIDDRNAGVLRTVNVRIPGSALPFPNYEKVPFLMVDFMQWLHSSNNEHPVIVAALAHFKLVTIHPFVDGNGRSSRLLMNLLLLQTGYPLAIITKESRKAYIDALETARATEDLTDFYMIVLQAVENGLDLYLQAIEG